MEAAHRVGGARGAGRRAVGRGPAVRHQPQLSLLPALHGNRALDVENFVKPVLDGLAAGLFSSPGQDPWAIKRFDYDDSNFSTLFIHRLPDAARPEDEGVAISVSVAEG